VAGKQYGTGRKCRKKELTEKMKEWVRIPIIN
jgi:hypothetical protein